ncbi:hypothetical protein QZH41_010683, partial [Actinostola sp. cb2023]
VILQIEFTSSPSNEIQNNVQEITDPNTASPVFNEVEVELVSQVGEGGGVVEPKPTSNQAGSKEFPCDQCTKVYKSKQSLVRHINSFHLKKKPFSCTICKKTFTRKDHLKIHQKLHRTGVEREFSCNNCSAKFDNINQLRGHLETAHPTPSTSREEPNKKRKTNTPQLAQKRPKITDSNVEEPPQPSPSPQPAPSPQPSLPLPPPPAPPPPPRRQRQAHINPPGQVFTEDVMNMPPDLFTELDADLRDI